MQTKNLLHKFAIGVFVLLSGWFLLTSSSPSEKKPFFKTKPVVYKETHRIFRLVNAKEIRDAIAASKDKKVILNIYPVKLSKDPEKNDFDLQILLQEAKENGKNFSAMVNTKKFAQQTGWYISYLKNKSVAKENIPHGYFIELNETSFKKAVGISIWVTPNKSQIQYFFLLGDEEGEDDEKGKDDDSNTCQQFPLAIMNPGDTAGGKCPPCRLALKNMNGIVEKAINTVFN